MTGRWLMSGSNLRQAMEVSSPAPGVIRRGHFSFAHVAPGVYAIVAQRTNFKPATAIITASRSDNRVEISLEARPAADHGIHSPRRLTRSATISLPRPGGSVYRFSAKTIGELPEGENTSLRNVLTQAPGVTQDSFENGGFHVRGVDGQVQYGLTG